MGICIQRTNYENDPVRNEWISRAPSLVEVGEGAAIDMQWTSDPLSAFRFENSKEALYWSACIPGAMVVRFGAEEIAPVEDKEAIEAERFSKAFDALITKRAEVGDVVAVAIKSEKDASKLAGA